MNYSQYQYLIDHLDRDLKKINDSYVAAWALGAKSKDILPKINKQKEDIEKIKTQLLSCVQEWVKVNYPNNLEMQKFWKIEL